MPGGAPQFRPRPAQNSASSSPFANPPGNPSNNSPAVRPTNAPLPVRPLMPAPQNSSLAPSMARPPINGFRPPLPPQSAPTADSNAAPLARGPPLPQASVNQAIRPPSPQTVAASHSPNSQFARPPAPQIPQVSPAANQNNLASMRPPIPVPNITQAASTQGIRPPMPSSQMPLANAPLKPPMPQSLQNSQTMGAPPARPPTVPRPQISRPPIMPMGTPASSPQAQLASSKPPMPSGLFPNSHPPVASGAPQAQMRPPLHTLPMQTKPSMPVSAGLNQASSPSQPQLSMPSVPGGPQVPVMRPPTMRYPAGPGYAQQQQQPHPQTQSAPVYPQSMPPTQQSYPSYPQAPNSAQYSNQGYSGASLASHQPPAPKVNPAAIPSVVAVLEADELRFKETGQPYYTFSSVVDNPPPLPTTRSVSIVDDGNSSPQFIRSTLNHIPISEEICENTKIPLSLIIQPFATNPQADIPLVDFGASGPIRCNRCRAYINPHVQFIKGGRYYVCNLCDMSNEVPEEYYANLDMSGKRIDLDLRPELKFGTVDFVASKVRRNFIMVIITFNLGIYE